MSIEETIFPSLSGFEPTRQTLQLYSRIMSSVPGTYLEFHPKWWHISLEVQPDGLITKGVALPQGGQLRLKMDLMKHKILLLVDEQPVHAFSMQAGKSATSMADDVLGALAGLGLQDGIDRDWFENDEPREYDPVQVGRFLTALVSADRIFKAHRATLSGESGPVQFWAHGFDLSFEWFGTRLEEYEEEGEVQEIPAQLNLGFYPGSTGVEPYFYSNPWPFEGDALLGAALPEGARWHTEGWQGTILPYEALVGDRQAEERLLAYAAGVFELASPTLIQGWGNGSD
jgi:hypothetical protein